MRLPIFPVLGAFLFIAIVGPFVLMLAGPAGLADPEAARIGLYLLLNVNPVAIPSVLFLLGVAWVVRRCTAAPDRPVPRVAPAPQAPAPAPQPVPSRHPTAMPSQRRTARHRDVVIDVMAAPATVRPCPGGAPRLAAPATPYLALLGRPSDGRASGGHR